MKTLIVYAHPRFFSNPNQKESIRNKIIIDALSKLPNVTYKDIYLMLDGKALFTPEQIQTEVEDFKKYDRIIIQSPLFCYSVSHIAKLYIDQIIAKGTANLKGKEFGIIFTAGAKVNELPSIEQLSFPFTMCAQYAQMKNAKSFIFGREEGEEKINEIIAEYSK